MALAILDRGTGDLARYPAATHGAEDAPEGFHNFIGSNDEENAKLISSDNAGEIAKSCEKMQLRHGTSTPRRPQNNGVAERSVCRVIEGTKACLLQRGLGHSWWREVSMCTADNITLQPPPDGPDAPSGYEQRREDKFGGVLRPFGCAVECRSKNEPRARECN